MLKAVELSVEYPGRNGPVLALDGLNLVIERGECLGVVGESGCGKSTLAKAFVGLVRPSGGAVLLHNRDLNTLSRKERHRARSQVQIVFQDSAGTLNPWRKIGSTISDGLIAHSMVERGKIPQRVAELLSEVGLDPILARRYPHELSGGQRQRVGIARALSVEPEMIIADEPVSALDVSVQAHIIELFLKLKETWGLTTVFISHDLAVIGLVADRVAVMHLGRIVELAGRNELLTSPHHPYTQMLLASILEIDTERKTPVIRGEIADPASPPSGCAFHPRCPHAIPQCSVERPELLEVARGHFSACPVEIA